MPKIRYTYLYICIFILICIGLSISWSAKEGFTNYTLPRTIWSYWHDPNIPSSLRKILSERQAVLSTWEHRVLNEVTVYDYIAREEFPHKYNDLGHQHKADWIRLYLLKRYGGCWMDASILVNRSEEIEDMYTMSVKNQSELTAYSTGTNDYIENFFLMAPLESNIIRVWFDEFTEAVEIGFLAYKKKVFSKIDVSYLYGRDNDDVYLTQHACLQYVLRTQISYTPNLYMKNVWESMYKYQGECNHDNKCVVDKLKTTPKGLQPANIKLTRFNRTFFDT